MWSRGNSKKVRESFEEFQKMLGFFHLGSKKRMISMNEHSLHKMRDKVADNIVRTSKYTMINFVPINLF